MTNSKQIWKSKLKFGIKKENVKSREPNNKLDQIKTNPLVLFSNGYWFGSLLYKSIDLVLFLINHKKPNRLSPNFRSYIREIQ